MFGVWTRRAQARLTRPFALLLCVALAAISTPGVARTFDQSLNASAEAGVRRGYPGMAIGIRVNGKDKFGTAGFADLEGQRRLRFDDPFHIGSITKVFTAVAALKFADQGRLSLDATIASILGDQVRAIPHSDRITVRQLIDHSSGIYATNNDLAYISTLLGENADPKRVFTDAELIALADGARNPATHPPGEGHSYSDSNYTLLGMIVEKVARMPLRAHVRRILFHPLGMRSTLYYSDVVRGARKPPKNLVQGYLIESEDIRGLLRINSRFLEVRGVQRQEGRVLNTTLASERIDGAGGIISTLPDLFRFGSALFDGKLLSPESNRLMLAALDGMDALEPGKKRRRALEAARTAYGTIVYKTGDGPGGTTEILGYLPQCKLMFAAFTNSFGYFDEVDYVIDRALAGQAERNCPVKR